MSLPIKQLITRQFPTGYLYSTFTLSRNGWRQVGHDAIGIMDDFGNLIFV